MAHKEPSKGPYGPEDSSINTERKLGLEPSASAGQGVVEDEFGSFHRSFTPRQIHVISLGSNIGSGLFIGSGKALVNGGPGGLMLGYFIVCVGVWANLQTLTEMTIAYPTSGNYIDYAGRWVDPALAFGAGLAEWLGWTSVFASEATFFVVLLDYWVKGSVPTAAWLSIFLIICLIVFLLPNTYFAWLQYFGSLVKVFLFLFNIVISLAVIGGAGPTGSVKDGSTWTDLPAFKNGFGGFASAALLGIWAIGDQIFIGVMGGEAECPRYSMVNASNVIPWRIGTFYLVSAALVTVIVPSSDERLLGGSGAAASPFVIAVADSGIKGVPDIINACMIVGILAIALESIYLPSRILREMALQKLVPLSGKGTEILNWFISITSASYFCNWAIVAFTSLRFHAAIKAQGIPIFSEAYGWQSFMWPFAPATVLVISAFLFVALFYSGSVPLGGGPFSAYTFFTNTLGLYIIVGGTIGYKILMRTKWQNPATADMVRGRRQLSEAEIMLLDKHYSRPLWRRIGTYVKPW